MLIISFPADSELLIRLTFKKIITGNLHLKIILMDMIILNGATIMKEETEQSGQTKNFGDIKMKM